MLNIMKPAKEMEVLCFCIISRFLIQLFVYIFSFALDCRGKLQCIASKCQTLGHAGDYCESDDQCRSNLFCFDRRRNGDSKCVKKRFPGMLCQLNSQCYNSICMELQQNKQQQNFRRRRPPRIRKYCVIMKSEADQPCDPRSLHCTFGLSCKPIQNPAPGPEGQAPSVPNLRSLFETNSQFQNRPSHGRDYSHFGGRGNNFGGQFQRSFHLSTRFKRQNEYNYDYQVRHIS